MAIHLLLRFPQIIPDQVKFQLEQLARIDGRNIYIYDLHLMLWKKVFDILKAYGVSRSPSDPFRFIETEEYNWQIHTNDCIAAVVDADEVQDPANPKEDYQPAVPAPHYGYVPAEKSIYIRDMPQGHVVQVGRDIIMSRQLVDVLSGSSVSAKQGEVVYRSQIQSDWVRYFATERCKVIGAESFLPTVICPICNAPLTPKLGVWLEAIGAKFYGRTVEDEAGYDHLDHRHALVISPELAAFLDRHFGLGLTLEPVYRRDSPMASLVLGILERVDCLTSS